MENPAENEANIAWARNAHAMPCFPSDGIGGFVCVHHLEAWQR